MQRRFHNQNWAWEHFDKDGTKYLEDRTHWNVWCKRCLRSRYDALKEADEQLVPYGHIEAARSEDELRKQAKDVKYAICGKIPKLHTHLARCPLVDPRIRQRAALDQGRGRGPKSAALPVPESSKASNKSGTQEWFEKALCRTVASAGWSWNSINDPEFTSMMKALCPDLEIPDRRVLSGRVLDGEITRVISTLKEKVEQKLATGMCDGWKNVSRTSVISCMITVDYQAHIVHTHDISAQRKTADNLLSIVLADIKYVQTELGVIAVAWCTDASGEARAMRCKLYNLMPHLVVLDCYPHQINLVVGDIFKRVPEMAEVAANANKIAKWFRNHSFALGLLRKCQEEENGTALALILAVITRSSAKVFFLSE